ncbi:VWA domain-containing protein [Thermosynechococcus sichuanensis E542]|uniref:VWA domain-containing protein n=1 Tax=Thermosynechococcus sichuanensis TaxID=3161974 RepID=UPI0015E4B01B|nr:VWA domain-containing protein [Thermosynechococcus vestitus]AXY68578.2 VWA domain-containing protein [Thermosynechococcus vestitus E542]
MNPPVVPGNRPLTPQQKDGLAWVGRWGGRDVVLAIDLTESVGLNDPGRLHLRQIIEKTLTKGDTVHILPFAMTVRSPVVFEYQGPADIPKILEAVPMNAGTEQGTDIMCAELFVYRYLAQLNQDRLHNQQPIKNQSVIWITDAPLNLPQGQADQWIEVPTSVCGLADTPEAQERSQWFVALPMQQRSIQPGKFQLTVVDVPATVQEFCTPKPGGGDICLVDAYLRGQLGWQILLVSVLGVVVLGGGLWFAVHWLRQQIPWSDKQSSLNWLASNFAPILRVNSICPMANWHHSVVSPTLPDGASKCALPVGVERKPPAKPIANLGITRNRCFFLLGGRRSHTWAGGRARQGRLSFS